jgi:predicted nucleotidyltransferase
MDSKVLDALRIFARILRQDGHRFVLIGASVPQLIFDIREGVFGTGSRETKDVDAVAEVSSWNDFNQLRERILQAGFRQGRVAHEFFFDDEVRIDLIPFGPALIEQGRLSWPGSGTIMNSCGLAEALDCARDAKIADRLTLPVVTIPGLVLTKIIAYLDRPEERARDLIDILYCFQHYETKPGASRRFDLADVQANDKPLSYEDAGAYLIGIEIAALAKPNSLAAVHQFVQRMSDEFARPIGQLLAQERRLVDNEHRRGMLYRLFQVFFAGINQSRSG